MAQCWYWGLLLCQLAAWASAAPVNADKGQEKAANRQEFSSHHTQLTDSTQGASGTAKHSADPKSLPIIQNNQPQAPQQDSGKSKGTENSSITGNSHSGGAGSTKTEKDTDKSREGQTGISDTPSVPEPKTKDSKQEEDPSIKNPNAKSDGSAQDSRKIDSVQTKNIQENPDDLEESETDASHPDLNVKKVQLSKDLEPKDQNLPVQKPTSTKEDSSEVTNAQEDTSFPKPKTKDSKQEEDPSIKDVNISDAQDPSSNLNPVQAKNKKTNTDISDANFSDQEVNDESKPMEDASAKDQDPQSDLSGKHLQKSNPVESPKAEEEVVDPKDEPKKGLGDEKKKSAKHEEDSEGTPKNGSENSHFFAYLVTTAIVVAALYIAYHNKRKIIAFALEGKKAKTARRPKSSDYQRLDQKI